MAAFQQAGDFKSVNVDGKTQKTGGNVATCFCTADGRVIHAVGGPVEPDRFLDEARWAVDVVGQVSSYAPSNAMAQALLVRQAHVAELGFHGQRGYAAYGAWGNSAHGRPAATHVNSLPAGRGGNDRAHQILAAEPLSPFLVVRKPIFEALTGESYSDNRSLLYLAAEGLQRARQRDAPVVFVLYDGHGPSAEYYDPTTQWLLGSVFPSQPVAAPLQSFLVVAIPARQLAALTQLAELPEFEFSGGFSPAIVITDAGGNHLDALDGHVDPQRLAHLLWATSGEDALARADRYAKNGKAIDGLRLLQRFHKAPLGEDLREEFNVQIASMHFQLAQQWAADGRATSALRLLHRLCRDAPQEPLRQRAGVEIRKLQSKMTSVELTAYEVVAPTQH